MRISIIVAVSENGVIGKNNDIPWRLSSDLKRFKRLTMEHTLLMGRKTFDSIGKPLPGRKTVVLSRKPEMKLDGVAIFSDLEKAVFAAKSQGEEELFIAGGAEIYAQSFPIADRILLTRVHATIHGSGHCPGRSWTGRYLPC